MKNIIYLTTLLLFTGLYLTGCDFGVPDENTNPDVPDATISGQIVESISGDPVFNATVKITDGTTQVNTKTGNDGSFSASFPLSEDKELSIVYSKSGYDTDTTSVYVSVSGDIQLPF